MHKSVFLHVTTTPQSQPHHSHNHTTVTTTPQSQPHHSRNHTTVKGGCDVQKHTQSFSWKGNTTLCRVGSACPFFR